MAISDTIQSMRTNLSNAYTAVEGKGGTMPSNKNLANLPSAIDSITAGDDESVGQYLVRVIDYDGTVLKEKYLDEGDIFDLPPEPSHSDIGNGNWLFSGWSSPVAIVNNKIEVEDRDITIGALYTANVPQEVDITLTKATGLTFTINTSTQKNWGDGTIDKETSHTYSDYGNYTITFSGSATTSYSAGVFGQNSSEPNYSVTAIRQGSGNSVVPTGDYSYQYCQNLQYIILKPNLTSISAYMFPACRSLKHIIFPTTIKTLSNNAFTNCTSLDTVILPKGVTDIGTGGSVFSNCVSLKNMAIPDSVTDLLNALQNTPLTEINIARNSIASSSGIGSISSCQFLKKIIFPPTIKRVETAQGCYSLTYMDFSKSTSVPPLSQSGAFNGINGFCRIIVPDALYERWIAATNWSQYANYIYKASEV